MSHPLMQIRRKELAAGSVTTNGHVFEWQVSGPIIVMRVGLTATVAITTQAGQAYTYTMSRRVTLGSASGAVTLGTFTAAPLNVTRAIGSVLNKKLVLTAATQTSEDGKPRNVAPNQGVAPFEVGQEMFYVPPGQSFAITADGTAPSAGSALPWIEYIELPWNGFYVDQTTIFEDVTNLPT